MRKLFIGTSNSGKSEFYKSALSKFFPDLSVITPQELGVELNIEEIGETFEENAILKARAWARASKLPTLSVDGGMMIHALGGAPGVLTHRWAGEGTTDQEKVAFLLEKLHGVTSREATWREAVAVAKPDGRILLETADDDGFILEEAVSLTNPWPGLWVTPVWFVPEFKKPWLALTPEEHEEIDSTYKALRKLQNKLYNFLEA